MKPVFAVSSLVLLVMVGVSTSDDDDDAQNDIPWGQQQPYMPDQLYQQYGQTSPTTGIGMDPNMMLMMVSGRNIVS